LAKSPKAKYSSIKFKRSLKKKGFIEDTSGHHVYYTYYYNGLKTGIWTKMSHSEPGFGDTLLKARKNQMKLGTTKNFLDFMNCPMTKEKYEAYLLGSNLISP